MLVATAVLAGCSPPGPEATQPDGPASVSFLGEELLRIQFDMARHPDPAEARALTDCAAAEAMLLQDLGYARHVRTTMSEEAGISRLDAVYTVSPTEPAGDFVIVAETVAAECRDQGTTGV